MAPARAVLDFIATAREAASREATQAAIVRALAPAMGDLLTQAGDVLDTRHRQSHHEAYARHEVFTCPESGVSLFAMVWQPGQWTPVHDHSTWGMVGVVEGTLHEHGFSRCDDGPADAESGVVLRDAGTALLTPGAVCTFVADPEHIHRTGVPTDGGPALTLHLYGRPMVNFNQYNIAACTRRLITVSATHGQ